jgi:hypothetical protein
MRGKLIWALYILLGLVLVTGLVIWVATGVRGRSMAEREPVTLKDLDRVASQMLPPSRVGPSQSESHGSAAMPPSSPKYLVGVPSLKEVPSLEVLKERFQTKRGDPQQYARDARVLKALESALWAVGAEESAGNWDRQIGEMLMWGGEWDEARRYLYEAVDAPIGLKGDAASKLAWLERDPEKATRLIEMSCSEGWLTGSLNDLQVRVLTERLENAVDLARATGSDASADYYLQRLRRIDPERARAYDQTEDTDALSSPGPDRSAD